MNLKQLVIYSKTIFLFLFLFSNTVCAQIKNESSDTWAEKLTDNFINLHPDTAAYKDEAKSYKWNYEQGLILESFYQMWKMTGDEKYFDYIKKNIDYYIEDDGTIKTYKLRDYNIDNIAPGRQLLHLYEETKNEKYRMAADTIRKQLEEHPRTSEGGFWHKKIYPFQMWLDGLYMGTPFYAEYSLMFNQPEAFDDITKQFLLIQKHLKDNKTGLYYHGWDESKEQKWADPKSGTSPNFWGRAMGWFSMALVDVLDFIPEDHPSRNEIIKMLQDLSASLLEFRDDETGLWYQVVNKGNEEGNYIEASASSMFTYAFAKGANKGYLDKKYMEIAKNSFESIIENLVTINDEGLIFLNNVCAVAGLGGDPYRDGSYEYYVNERIRVNDFKGYGPFTLAAIEIEKGSKAQNE